MIFNCDCSVECYERATTLKTAWRKARKVHLCGECGREIVKGDRYLCETTLYDGSLDHHKTCVGCHRIRDEFCSGGYVWGEIAQQVGACIGFDYSQDLDEVPDVTPEEEQEHIVRVRAEQEKRG